MQIKRMGNRLWLAVLLLAMRNAHMSRGSKGKCAANLTVPYNKLLHIIDRMGNNCVNIADTALKKVNLQYFTALEA